MKIYIETYGCQMNFNDSEIVASLVSQNGYQLAESANDADCILINTCSVRDNAEKRVFERLKHLKQFKKKNNDLIVGVLGCMAERLRNELFEASDLVKIVIGPDEYRKLPSLIEMANSGTSGIAVKLSQVETYDDIQPLRTDGLSAFLSIMRGCNNFCSYCVVPFTRGAERSRPYQSILDEVCLLWEKGYKEITLLGQNVNSYSESQKDFADLLSAIARLVPQMRIRFTTSHPRDMGDKLIETVAEYHNICKHIHLPVQSGSDRILSAMNRGYSVSHYLSRIEKIHSYMPNCAISTDLIAGFPDETDEDHKATLNLLNEVRFDGAFMFRYSPRENTKAFEMKDNVPEEIKIRRLNEIIDLQQSIATANNKNEIGKVHQVLVEGESKRNPQDWKGRSDTNKVVVFPLLPEIEVKIGDIVNITIRNFTAATLLGNLQLDDEAIPE